jgi:hypothetical protein
MDDLTHRLAAVLGEFGIRSFLIIGNMGGDDVVVSAVGCSDCLIPSLAGGIRAYPEIKRLVVEALAVSEERGSREPVVH